MNKRQEEILLLLLSESKRPVLIQNIADQLNCSEKTIRNDFKVIEELLVNYPSASLIKKPGLGVYLKVAEYERIDLYNKLNRSTNLTRYESDKDRLIQIAFNLLMDSKVLTVHDLASQYYVSRAIIKKDLMKIEKWLNNFDLTVVSKQRVGLMIEGNEKNIRKALARLSELISNVVLTNQFIKEQFLLHEVEFVTSELKKLQNQRDLPFTDDTFDSLLIHTLLMVRRMKLKQSISISNREIEIMQKKKEYDWTLIFLNRLEKVFAVDFSEEEVTYLTAHILGGKFRYQMNETERSVELNPILSKTIHLLVSNMSRLHEIEFSRDHVLIEGLYIHLNSTLNRLDYNLSVSNPMLRDIKRIYSYMFNTLIQVLTEINESLKIHIPEEEAAYLTLHFEASIERLDQKEITNNVIIVCHMGIGMSHLLRTKMERKFRQIKVMTCIAKADLEDYLRKHDEIDFVISTVDLQEVTIPYFVVSPLLEGADEMKLNDFIAKLNKPESNEKNDFVMLNYTTPFLVFLHQNMKHPYEIIEKLAHALHTKGFVEEGYAENAILREKMSSTTIGAGIAIPHGNPKLIKQSAIAIATVKEAIDWGQEKVSLVILLAVKSNGQEETKELFREISFLSEQPGFVQQLTKETNIMKFLSYLKY